MKKKIEEKQVSMEDLVDRAAMMIHLGLLENGSKGMRSAIWGAFLEVMAWKEEKEKGNKK